MIKVYTKLFLTLLVVALFCFRGNVAIPKLPAFKQGNSQNSQIGMFDKQKKNDKQKEEENPDLKSPVDYKNSIKPENSNKPSNNKPETQGPSSPIDTLSPELERTGIWGEWVLSAILIPYSVAFFVLCTVDVFMKFIRICTERVNNIGKSTSTDSTTNPADSSNSKKNNSSSAQLSTLNSA